MSKPDIEAFIEQANLHHPTIEFTAETFDTETAVLDKVVYKRTRFKEKSILDAKTNFKQTETFLHTHFTSCHPSNVKKDLSKEEPSEFYEKTPQKQPLRKIIQILKKTLDGRRLPQSLIKKPTIRNKIHKRESKLLKQNNKEEKEILPFVTQYQPSVSTTKEAWMKKLNLIQNRL